MSYSAVDLTPRTGTATFQLFDTVELECRANFTGPDYEPDSLDVEIDGNSVDLGDISRLYVEMPGFFGGAKPPRLDAVLIGLCRENAE